MKRNLITAAIGEALLDRQLKDFEQQRQCNYYSWAGHVCNKCGQVHNIKQLVHPLPKEEKQ